MADFLMIGNRLINLDQITKAILDFQTHRQEKCVMLYFSDGREALLNEDDSARFRAFFDQRISQGFERRL